MQKEAWQPTPDEYLDTSTPEVLEPEIALQTRNLTVFYDKKIAVKNINLDIYRGKITAFIGPSGCGKSTVLRAFDRMNELIPKCKTTGEVYYRGQNLYASHIDPVEVRRLIGMVFQKANPFPKSIYDNVAYGPRLQGIKNRQILDEIVETSLQKAYLWDEVRGDLKKSGLSLSGGQQQRLCIARAIAINPDVILMDEPCSALDPISTQAIEELMQGLVEQDGSTILIVTHNMQQARRISDYTVFFNIRKGEENSGKEQRWGEIVEYNDTDSLFENPQEDETGRYIRGEFG